MLAELKQPHQPVLIFCLTGRVETIDARETAAMNATEDMFGNNTKLSRTGTITSSCKLLEYFPGAEEREIHWILIGLVCFLILIEKHLEGISIP